MIYKRKRITQDAPKYFIRFVLANKYCIIEPILHSNYSIMGYYITSISTGEMFWTHTDHWKKYFEPTKT